MRYRWIAPLTLAFLAGVALSACGTSEAGDLSSVPTRHVCMVNDHFFGTDQIPVKVDGRTYYGCCEGCKKTLREKRSARFAIDPVSRREVDKATAVIGALPNGRVFYFENERNLKEFRAPTRS